MTRRTILPLLAVVLTLTVVPLAQAHWFSDFGRHLGVGWSDGYHAHNDCPPQHGSAHCRSGSPESVWWGDSAKVSEGLPQARTLHGGRQARSGPTLFRQPGEGSSVNASEHP
jgi:hypothetical protein